MAIDTINKRKSVIGAGRRWWHPSIIEPDGSIGREDKVVVGRGYFGIVPNITYDETGKQVTILAVTSEVDNQTMQELSKLITTLVITSETDIQIHNEEGQLVTVLVVVTGTDVLIPAPTAKGRIVVLMIDE